MQSLTADVTALQQLSETEPHGLTLVEGGLCQNTCALVATILACLLNGTCKNTFHSPPKE
jgi:hypothetical protein